MVHYSNLSHGVFPATIVLLSSLEEVRVQEDSHRVSCSHAHILIIWVLVAYKGEMGENGRKERMGGEVTMQVSNSMFGPMIARGYGAIL